MVTAPILEFDNPRPLTADDLLDFPDDGNRYEIIGGELFVSPSPSYPHQRVSMKLGNALDTYLTQTGIGEVVAAPMDVHLSASDLVQPDLLVLLVDGTASVHRRGVYGAPDLVVEIVSPSSTDTDFLRKSKLYEQSGVREYWIVNPENDIVSVQVLDGERFVITGQYGRDDILTSAVLDGFALELSVLFPQQIDVQTEQTTEESQATHDE